MKPPKTKEALLCQYKKAHTSLAEKMKKAGEAVFPKTLKFRVAQGKIRDVNMSDMLWLLDDQIHHRGQPSVCLRLEGARGPSICGPSADGPW